MAEKVLVDAGPLVALLNRQDRFHDWAVAQASRMPVPLRTCDAVLSEAFYLLGSQTSNGVQGLCAMIERRFLISEFTLSQSSATVLHILTKYKDLPASFADACLVAMAERVTDSRVFTLDGHFKLYRKTNRKSIPLITAP